MKIIVTLTFFVLFINIQGQVRTIQGKIVDEHLDDIPFAIIFTEDTVEVGKANLEGEYIVEIPRVTKKLIIAFVGFEWTTIEINDDCDTFNIIMMYSVHYDFVSTKKVNRLRQKRFNKLPRLHEEAFEKRLFNTPEPCYNQTFAKYSAENEEE